MKYRAAFAKDTRVYLLGFALSLSLVFCYLAFITIYFFSFAILASLDVFHVKTH